MRTYLAIVDESPEAAIAVQYAARRAHATNGALRILTLVELENLFVLGGAQATIEDEAKNRAETLVSSLAGNIFDEIGIRPRVSVVSSNAPKQVRKKIEEIQDVAMLILGASESGKPGPLVSYFTGSEAGSLPFPVLIVPGALTDEDINRIA